MRQLVAARHNIIQTSKFYYDHACLSELHDIKAMKQNLNSQGD